MSWIAIPSGLAIAAIAAAEYLGVLTADNYAPFVLVYGLLFAGLGVISRGHPPSSPNRQLLNAVGLIGFVASGCAVFGAHSHRAFVISLVLFSYLTLAEDMNLAAILMGGLLALAGVAGAIGRIHADQPGVDVVFGVALIALGLSVGYEPWRTHNRYLAFGTLAAGLAAGLWFSGFWTRTPLAIDLSTMFALSCLGLKQISPAGPDD